MLSSKEGHVESSRVALVVGIGNYKNFGRLDCCPPSAIDVYHLLIDKQFGCCDPDRSILLIGEDQSIVTARRLQDSMEAIAQKISIKDQFIFFFCGHGKVDDKFELTLLMSDSLEQNNIIFQGYDLDQLVKYFGKSINNAIVIIDACHSEAIMKAMQYRQDKNIAFMWSCNAEKTSAQSQKLGKTYFSYYFCKGIKELKNKKIEIDQLVKYINKHAGMNQQADCYAKSDTWVSKGNNFPFINRESELSDIIYKNNEYIRCQIIDAPEGYGKTAVLQKVKKELEDKGVSCFLFKINEKLKKEDQIDSFLKYFIFHAFGSKEKFMGKDDYIVYIANKIKNILEERREYIEHKFIFSLMIDIEDNQCCELVQFISEKFIPDIIRATGYGKEIFFFISGRYISKTIYISDARVASKKIALPAFSYKHVLQIIKAHFAKEKNIDNFPVSDIAAHLFFSQAATLAELLAFLMIVVSI